MRKEIAAIVVTLSIFFIFLLSHASFMVYGESIVDKDYLENLRLQANLECLQNSQCSEGYECIKNECVNDSNINICKDFSLSTPTRKVEVGQPINSIKEVLTDSDLPYLLSDGLIIEGNGNNITEYYYTQAILVGNSNIEKENQDYIIKTKDNSGEYLYKLRIVFSNGIDFSDSRIRGQVLRILGKEYIIGNDSSNSSINLISEGEKIKLENNKNIKIGEGLFPNSIKATNTNIIKGKERKVIGLEIEFNKQGEDKSSIKVKENYIDPAFNRIKLSFDNANDDFADVKIGGDC